MKHPRRDPVLNPRWDPAIPTWEFWSIGGVTCLLIPGGIPAIPKVGFLLLSQAGSHQFHPGPQSANRQDCHPCSQVYNDSNWQSNMQIHALVESDTM